MFGGMFDFRVVTASLKTGVVEWGWSSTVCVLGKVGCESYEEIGEGDHLKR